MLEQRESCTPRINSLIFDQIGIKKNMVVARYEPAEAKRCSLGTEVNAISNLTIVQGKINGYTIESDELNDEFVHGTVLVWVEPEPILIDLMEARLMEDDSLLEGDLSPEILVLIDEQVRQFE